MIDLFIGYLVGWFIDLFVFQLIYFLLTYLFIYFFLAPKALTSLGLKYWTKKIHVWNGHGVDSETVNVSARQAALNRWTATDRGWNKNVVSFNYPFVYLFILFIAFVADVSGEVSECQKQELEKYQDTVRRQESELVEVRQQLAKLSEIVDRQTDDMKQMNAEARSAVALTYTQWHI